MSAPGAAANGERRGFFSEDPIRYRQVASAYSDNEVPGSGAAAYTQALGRATSLVPFDLDGIASLGWFESGVSSNCAIVVAKFRFRFLSCSCYFKAWWDVGEIKWKNSETPPDPTITDSLDWTFTPTNIGGLCLPAGYDYSDQSTWQESEDFTLTPPQPDLLVEGDTASESRVSIYNLRWSFIEGYDPPTDGSANGFPA